MGVQGVRSSKEEEGKVMKPKSFFIIRTGGWDPESQTIRQDTFVVEIDSDGWSLKEDGTFSVYDAGAGPGPCGQVLKIPRDKWFNTKEDALHSAGLKDHECRFGHYENDEYEFCEVCGEQGERAAKEQE